MPNEYYPPQPPPLVQRQTTLSAYAEILDEFSDGPTRQWSIRQANSRLQSQGLHSALESDLSLHYQGDEHKAIPMTDLSSRENSPSRQSNNPYLTDPSIQVPGSTPSEYYHNNTPSYPQRHDSNATSRQRSLKHKTYGFHDPFAEAPMEAWQEMKDYNLRANGLPTLDQMMRLHTLTPLNQSNFATFLRRRGVHQNLNFLLELETHDKLWRAHIQSQRRQTKERLSRFLESAAEKPKAGFGHAQKPSLSMAAGGYYQETPDTDDLLGDTPFPQNDDGYASRMPQGVDGQSLLSRHDLAQNATRIYRTFCSPLDAAQPIHLPDDHRVALEELIEKHHRPEPVVFDSARSHVFEILNVFYYPQFVDSVLYSNLAKVGSRVLLGFGILLLVVGFAVEFSFIFLDSGGIAMRWWGLLPFFLGWSAFIASFLDFAYWLAFTGKM